ncbi:hypothetical protein ANN_01284 [Periplaneta americana]|uniref:Uncharacterized protein n=1 Tax=Periplaneta americana TaxID=6978 RepID=A0ABQ8TT46_PERAM|nr:hypothetical protein ANN_01284 [Periplaneta americana]
MVLDSTICFERDTNQALQINDDKRAKYVPCLPYLSEKYGISLYNWDITGLLFEVAETSGIQRWCGYHATNNTHVPDIDRLLTSGTNSCEACQATKGKTLEEGGDFDPVLWIELRRSSVVGALEEARAEKKKDKDNDDVSTVVLTMDMQAVLLAPSLKASALYYKTKLKVHNFTIYDINTAEGHCFLWDESEGADAADDFATLICEFMKKIKLDMSTMKKIIIFSEGCTLQNRNVILANAFLLNAVQTGVIIEQKYLEKGHTQMMCDSMHATIGARLKNREIYSPSGYVQACRTGRIKPKPYHVESLEHSFFKKYSSLSYITSIRPDTKLGDPVVMDIRCLKYEPDISIQYKLKFFDTADICQGELRSLPSVRQKDSN